MEYTNQNALTNSFKLINDKPNGLLSLSTGPYSTVALLVTTIAILAGYLYHFQLKKVSGPPVKSVPKDFRWDKVTPLKSYPFKNKEYKLTMGIKKVDPQEWLLVEPSYKHQLLEKYKILHNIHPEKPPGKNLRELTLFHTEEAVPAILEFYETVVSYMSTKYPMHFVKKDGQLHNLITKDAIPFTPSKTTDVENHLVNLAKIIQEDFIILQKDPKRQHEKDGEEYFFKGGVFAFAAGFDPKTRFNTPLSYVHHPIPGYEEKLKLSMNRYFSRIEPGLFVTRSNFSVQTHGKYYVDDQNKGHNLPEDHEQQPIPIENLDFEKQVHYRSERQVLTKLPKSKAVVFTIRTYLEPLSTIKSQGPELCERLIGAIDDLPHDIAIYKRSYEWGPPVKQYLSQA